MLAVGELRVWCTLLEEHDTREREREAFAHERASRTLRTAEFLNRHRIPPGFQYRKNDPESSRLSALYGEPFRPPIRARLLAALLRIRRGTVRQVAQAAGIPYHPAERRFSDLKSLGLVRGTGETVTTDAGGVAELYEPAGMSEQQALAL